MRYRERAMKKGASRWVGRHISGELLKDHLEGAPSETKVVHSQGDEAARRMVADEATWQLDIMLLVNFAFSANPREKSEL